MTKLAAILDQIDSRSVLLPEFQRGYVWNRDQVRGLMRSLYRGYPVGGLLTWETQADGSLVRRAALASPALRMLTLDGQQRITSLYGHHRECRRDPDEPVRHRPNSSRQPITNGSSSPYPAASRSASTMAVMAWFRVNRRPG